MRNLNLFFSVIFLSTFSSVSAKETTESVSLLTDIQNSYQCSASVSDNDKQALLFDFSLTLDWEGAFSGRKVAYVITNDGKLNKGVFHLKHIGNVYSYAIDVDGPLGKMEISLEGVNNLHLSGSADTEKYGDDITINCK